VNSGKGAGSLREHLTRYNRVHAFYEGDEAKVRASNEEEKAQFRQDWERMTKTKPSWGKSAREGIIARIKRLRKVKTGRSADIDEARRDWMLLAAKHQIRPQETEIEKSRNGNGNGSRKLHYRTHFAGFDISVENRPGTYRHWENDGVHGKTLMRVPYGYIRRTMGTDGDHVDCFLGPNENAAKVYVIHQLLAPDFDRHDEDKVVLGANSAAEAQKIYLDHYDDHRFFGGMTVMDLGEFRQKVFATMKRPAMIKAGTPQVVLQI
jgi:inorganic pyrophosphatase